MMDRRELIQRVAALMGGALSSGAVAGVLAGCVSSPEAAGNTKSFLTPDEMRTVTAMADQIIPRTDTPGALDVGVPGFVDRMLTGYYQDRERQIFRAGLMMATTDAAELAGKPFADLSTDQQVALMTEYDRLAWEQSRRNQNVTGASPHFFRLIKELTIVGFCTSEVGATKFLKYEAVPGPWRADIPYSEVGRAWAT
jgi:hypothetical protein